MKIKFASPKREPSGGKAPASTAESATGGLAGWLLQRLGARPRPRPTLALLERITLAPRQTLSLVEADGRRLLIATSAEGAPAFYSLDPPRARVASPIGSRKSMARTSW